MELIDTHCHLTFDELAGGVEGVIERSKAAGVVGWITVGTDPQQNRKAVEFAERYENVYAAVGIHPHEARTADDKTISELKQLAGNKKVVAIGETGLDFHRGACFHGLEARATEQQQDCFTRHLEIAAELKLPVIIHSREAFDETIEILSKYGSGLRGVVFHCFSGSAEQAKIVLDRGFYISFTGVVTFKNAEKTRRAAEVVPLDRLMVETDCPYMSPEPMRKQKVNEPAFMIHTARCLAQLKQMDLADFAQKITATSKTFFCLP
jgi:TatD DNase family protein